MTLMIDCFNSIQIQKGKLNSTTRFCHRTNFILIVLGSRILEEEPSKQID